MIKICELQQKHCLEADIVSNAYIRKEEISKVSNQSFNLRKLGN